MTGKNVTFESQPSKISTFSSVLPWLIGSLFLFIMPFLFTSNSALTIMNQMSITIVFALAYNMLLGQAGMLSFGHAVYMGVGGFVCVHIINFVDTNDVSLPLPFLPIFGGLFGLGLATIVGSFSTRKAGTVFAMISLGVGELIAACSVIIVVFFGGEEGISGDRTYMEPFFGIEFFKQVEVYYLTAFWLMLSAILMYLFSGTPIGRMANAVRDNPERTEFLGYSARWVRFYSFCASGFFCGIAGALFAINFEILTEENLNLATSGTILLVTFLGGTGLFFGPIVGAIVFTLLQTVLSLQTELWQLYLGVMFVATVMYFPDGLAGLMVLHKPVFRNGKTRKIFLPYFKTLIPAGACIVGTAGLCEMLFHLRHSPVGEHNMVIFWVHLSTHSSVPWIIFAGLTLSGFFLSKRSAPELVEAWTNATKVTGSNK